MLEVAICDDDQAQLSLVATYASDCFQTNSIPASISRFKHPDDLLESCEKRRYHLYILDIVMPMINGVEVGRIIRGRDRHAVILYTTHEPSFALESFDTAPVDYLLKPIDRERLCRSLLSAIARLTDVEERTCIVKTADGMQVLTYAEILFCEYSRHTVRYTLTGNRSITTCVIRGTFAEHVKGLLEDGRFLRPHVSYVVNMDFIEGFSKTRFTLRSGETVPIVARHYRAVRDAFLHYLLSKGEPR